MCCIVDSCKCDGLTLSPQFCDEALSASSALPPALGSLNLSGYWTIAQLHTEHSRP